MSDVEEPPTKISKYEMSQTYTQPEEMDDGQEEWLSEGLLTDDDNPAQEQDRSDSALDNNQLSNSQDITAVSQDTSSKVDDSAIEQELNNMDSEQQSELPDDLSTFLVKKTDNNVSQPEEEESDGNDTDDLLRMLEDDGKTKQKKKVKFSVKVQQQQDTAENSSGDDDDFVYEAATVKKLRVAKNVLMRKMPATKAEPEDSSEESDESTDEAATVKKMFGVRKNNFASKSTAKPHVATPRPTTRANVAALKKPDNVIQVLKKAPVTRPVTSTPIKQYGNKGLQNKSILKTSPVTVRSGPPTTKQANQPTTKPVNKPTSKPVNQLTSKLVNQPTTRQANQPITKQVNQPATKQFNKSVDRSVGKKNVKLEEKEPTTEPKDFDEIINEEEFLEEEDEFDLDEDFADESDEELDRRALKHRSNQSAQIIRRPEQLDEEMYSDGESQADDDSLYEDLPSSDSEDLEDWFTLDLRSERAGDYLPLLGAKAYELLLEEKRRVSSRVDELRKRLESINDANRLRSDRVRAAATALADVEDMIKAG